jgi:hypothetical protein
MKTATIASPDHPILLSLGLALACLTVPLSAQVSFVSVGGRDLTHLVADYNRPFVYGLNRGASGTNASLVAINATNGVIERELTLPANPTDMDIAFAEDALYVIHFGIDQISKVDLASFSVQSSLNFSPPGNWGGLPDVWYDVKAGRPGIVYFIDGRWGPTVHALNFLSGQELGAYDLDGWGIGDLAVSRDGNTMFVWAQYGWSAGNVNSWVSRLDISTNTFVRKQDSFTSWRRDPLDTPVLLTASEDRVFNKQQCFSTTNLDSLLVSFSENIYEISLHGDLAVGTAHVFNARTGSEVYALPFTTTIAAFSGDQKRLLLFNRTSKELALVPVSLIADIPGPELKPTPADGAVVGQQLSELSWSSTSIASRYEVYLGADEAAVGTAAPGSTLHLASMTGTTLVLTQPLVPKSSYFWRVDVVSVIATNRGPVWRFDVAPVTINPPTLRLGAIAGYSPAPQELAVQAAPNTTWRVLENSPWFDLSPSSGTGPATLRVAWDTAALAIGSYTNSFAIESEDFTLNVPVILDVVPLNILKMTPDLSRPYLYAIQGPGAGQSQHSLLVINTDTEQIERVLPIGSNPTDLSVHHGEGRLYIADWGHTPTYVVDLSTRDFATPLQLGTDVFKINSGRPGRIFIEGYDQWISASIVDTANGQIVGNLPWPVRQGDGEVSPDGRAYYHCDDNISNAHIHKYDITTDTPVQTAASLEHPYGSRNLILSGDGSRLLWRGFIYDANLNELGNLGEEIYATTLRGELAFSSSKVFNTANGRSIYSLPVQTTVQAVSGKQDKLFLFNTTNKRLVVIPMNQIASVPGPGLVPIPADGAVLSLPLLRLSWSTSPLALRYAVYFGGTRAAVEAATSSSTEFQGEVASTSFVLGNELQPGQDGFWRVDQIGFTGTLKGPVWQFHVAPIIVAPQKIAVRGVAGLPILPVSLTISNLGPGVGWTINETIPWLVPSATSGTTPATVALQFNTAGLAPGVVTNQVQITSGGVTLGVEISLELIRMGLTRMVADRERPYVYALHRGSGTFDDAFLIVINTATDQVERVLPIGANPTDFTIHYPERRLYVSNWLRNATRVVDLETFQELLPLQLGNDAYIINAGRAGRLYLEGQDQWVAASIISTVTGAVAGNLPWPVREGDAEISPDGSWYYHADNNISDAHIHKHDIRTDNPVEVAASPQHPFGSRNLILSADGSRLFWRGFVLDADLKELGSLGAEIYACTADGRFAFGSQYAYDTVARTPNFTLPFETTVMAIADSAGKLFAFNPATAAITSIPLAAMTNRAPTALNLAVVTPEDTPIRITLTAEDPENDQISFRVVASPSKGTLSGDPPNLTFSPTTNFTGIVSFNFVASDAFRTSAVARVTVTVTPVNDPPTALPQTVVVPAGGSREIQLSAIDPENSPVNFRIASNPAHGSLTGTPPDLTYTPANAYTGTDGFTFLANDGELDSAEATVSLQVALPSCIPTAPGLVSLWSGENSGYDSVGGHDGTPGAGLSYAPGKVGQAFVCNGQSAALRVLATSRLQVAGSATGFTLDAWVNPSSSTTRQLIFAWVESNSTPWLEMALVPEGASGSRLRIEGVLRGTDGSSTTVASAAVVTTNRFQHLAFTFSPNGNSAVLFRNGVVIARTNLISISRVARGDLFLGGPSASTISGALLGLLDEAAVHNRPLTEAEIAAIVGADSAGHCAEPRPPVIVVQPASVNIAAGGTAAFWVEATGAGPLAFQWRYGEQNLPGATNSILSLTNVTSAQAGAYSVVIGNAFGSVTSDPATLGVSLLANGSFESGNFSGWIVQDIPQPLRALTVRTAGLSGGFGFFRTQPSEGRFSAVHGWDGSGPAVIRLAQDVSLPTNGAALAFDYRAAWNLRDFGAALYPRVFRVVILPSGGGAALALYPILTAQQGTVTTDTGRRNAIVDLAAFSGRAVRLAFEWSVPESSTGPGFFELDNVILTQGAPPPPSLPASGLAMLQTGGAQLEFAAATGRSYTVHASTNLLNWTPIGPAIDLGGGWFRFVDAEATTTLPLRFYRLGSP